MQSKLSRNLSLAPLVLAAAVAAGCSSKFVVRHLEPPTGEAPKEAAQIVASRQAAPNQLAVNRYAGDTSTGGAGGIAGTAAPTYRPPTKRGGLDGLVYSLPRTVVRVTTPVTRKDQSAGLYSEFAEFFFLDEYESGQAVKRTGTSFAFGAPGFATAAEPDPKKVYYVRLNRGFFEWFRDMTGAMEFGNGNTLKSGEVTVTNTLPEVAIGAASLVSGLLTRTAFATPLGSGGKPLPSEENKQPPDDPRLQACKEHIPAAEIPFLEAIGKATNKLLEREPVADQLLFCQLRVPLARKEEYGFIKNATDLGKLAHEFRYAAAAYMEIQGVVSKLAETMASTLLPQPAQSREELERLIQQKSEKYFLGKVTRSLWTPTFTLREDQPAAVPLFSFSKTEGVCYIDPKQVEDGVLVNGGFCESTGSTREANVVAELRRLAGDDTASIAGGNFDLKKDQRGFAYRIPSMGLAVLKVDGKEQGRAQVAIAQFGQEATLPASLGGFSTSYKLQFDDATGAIRRAEFGRKSLVQKSMVDSASTNLNALLDARRSQAQAEKKQADAAAAAGTVGADLEKRRKLLETQLAVMEACNKLKLDCSLLIDGAGKPVRADQ